MIPCDWATASDSHADCAGSHRSVYYGTGDDTLTLCDVHANVVESEGVPAWVLNTLYVPDDDGPDPDFAYKYAKENPCETDR